MKRFYKDVAAEPVEGSAFEIHLDGRPVRTPLRQALRVPAGPLAEGIAGEWNSQEEDVDVDSMPFTRIAATAIDRVGSDRAGYTDQIAAYAETDLVCYRAPAPSGLVMMQSKSWQPLVEWTAETYGAVLQVTVGIAPIEQNPTALARIRDALDAHDAYELAALSVATAACGSVVIGLAMTGNHIDAQAAFEASQLDESYQNAIWGVDSEAQQRRDILQADLKATAEFLTLLRAG